jgi:hypothetical protein
MRWLDDVSMDLRKMGVNEWRDRARNREAWRHIVEEAKAHPGLYRHLDGWIEKNYVSLKSGKNTFLIISRSVLLRTRKASEKSCRENQNTFYFRNNFFPKIASFMR